MPEDLTYRGIFRFWLPLASTWLMMSVEGPLLAALIARLAEPTVNLAAYGVAFAFALIIEAPIIMIMSASTALVRDRESFRKMRNFTFGLILAITGLMLVVLLPPVFDFLAKGLVGLPENVAALTHRALLILLPWPGVIGYRRFYQGILIRNNLTRRVAYGTVTRLAGMGATAFLLYFLFDLPGALLGTASLSAGVTLEAAASRVMAASTVASLASREPATGSDALNYGGIATFYYPLALTSMLAMGVHPMVTFFVGQSRMAVQSLAVIPVVTSLVFIFRSLGLAFQEVAIALVGDQLEGFGRLRNFALLLMGSSATGLCLVAFSPLGRVWFEGVSGLTPQLADLAGDATRILAVIPALTVLLCFQRAMLVNLRITRFVTRGTAIEVLGIASTLFVCIRYLDWVGALAAATALLTGRALANIYLSLPLTAALRVRFREKPLPNALAEES